MNVCGWGGADPRWRRVRARQGAHPEEQKCVQTVDFYTLSNFLYIIQNKKKQKKKPQNKYKKPEHARFKYCKIKRFPFALIIKYLWKNHLTKKS